MEVKLYDSVEIPLRTRLAHFLTQLKLSPSSLLQAPFRLRQVLRPRSRLVPSVCSVFPTEDKRPSIYSEIGVGVYRGHPVILRQFGMPDECSRHWVISNLHSKNLDCIDSSLVSQSCQLTVLLKFLQYDHEMNHLQKLDEIELETDCPYNKQTLHGAQTSEALCDTAKCPIEKVLSIISGRDNPQAQIQQYLSTCPIFYRDCSNEANQPKVNDTNLYKCLTNRCKSCKKLSTCKKNFGLWFQSVPTLNEFPENQRVIDQQAGNRLSGAKCSKWCGSIGGYVEGGDSVSSI